MFTDTCAVYKSNDNCSTYLETYTNEIEGIILLLGFKHFVVIPPISMNETGYVEFVINNDMSSGTL